VEYGLNHRSVAGGTLTIGVLRGEAVAAAV
jgi:hypothetical protein